jgi:hypothetical protein
MLLLFAELLIVIICGAIFLSLFFTSPFIGIHGLSVVVRQYIQFDDS